MEKRRAGENPMLETRSESNDLVDREKRYKQILECFNQCKELTAKECAVRMYRKGYIPSTERNFTAPRITELCRMGYLEPIGKKTCGYTGRKVTVFSLRG